MEIRGLKHARVGLPVFDTQVRAAPTRTPQTQLCLFPGLIYYLNVFTLLLFACGVIFVGLLAHSFG